MGGVVIVYCFFFIFYFLVSVVFIGLMYVNKYNTFIIHGKK